jgi:hypothetical protein
MKWLALLAILAVAACTTEASAPPSTSTASSEVVTEIIADAPAPESNVHGDAGTTSSTDDKAEKVVTAE